jgi:hypothetical protein
MEGYGGFVLVVHAPGRSQAETNRTSWRHGQRMAVMGDVVEPLEVLAG